MNMGHIKNKYVGVNSIDKFVIDLLKMDYSSFSSIETFFLILITHPYSWYKISLRLLLKSIININQMDILHYRIV